MRLLVATRNRHKLAEIRVIWNTSGLELLSVDDFPALPEVEEDGCTLEANAVKKAVTLAVASGCWALADDSGLMVDALDGAPGVYSSRYAGEEGNYPANNRKLLQELRDRENRRAHFGCVIALSSSAGEARTVEGRCDGIIAHAPRGANGFGYDPLFIPDGYSQTFAEMNEALKNSLSHRARALAKAKLAWGDFLAREPQGWR